MTGKLEITRRKSVQLSKEVIVMAKRITETQELVKLAEQEEDKLREDTMAQIKKICAEKGLFCGAVLKIEDLQNILKIMVETQEDVRLSFGLYFKSDLGIPDKEPDKEEEVKSKLDVIKP